MDDPSNWMWIWLGAAVLFGLGEMASAGTFFLLPFAGGAVGATLLAAFGAPLLLQWVAFVVLSGAAFAALRPLAARLDRDEPSDGVGARRLIGERATVLQEIPADNSDLGLVRVHREEWRAESLDGSPIPVGALVRIVEMRGTRVVVFPTELPAPDQENP
ncbi:MAG TPA: NfeD family protein [Acidimicrobiales bacterium]|nr:NfeD family protein [Acidimicrobiales bacterium]